MNDAMVAVAAREGELDLHVKTAKAFPRDENQFVTTLRASVLKDEDTAEACIFALPRGNKTIQGPSVRFAELALPKWGNCSVGARIVHETHESVTAQGIFIDLENNYRVSVEVSRSVLDRNGNRYGADLVNQTRNAAIAIAIRNVALKGVPRALWEGIYQEAMKKIAGDASMLSTRRATALAYLAKLGVTEAMVLRTLKRSKVEEITQEDLVSIRAAARQVRDGEVALDDAFLTETSPDPASPGTGVAAVAAAVAGRGAPPPPPPATRPPTVAELADPAFTLPEPAKAAPEAVGESSPAPGASTPAPAPEAATGSGEGSPLFPEPGAENPGRRKK